MSFKPLVIRWPLSRLIDIAFIIMLAVGVVFLQEGVTYYISFQVFALGVVVWLAFCSGVKFRSLGLVFFVLSLFFLSVCFTTILSPVIISRNSSNMLLTVIGIGIYASIILLLPSLSFKKPDRIFRVVNRASLLVLLVIFAMLVLGHLDLFSHLSRESLFIQNSRLVTNFSSIDVLLRDLSYRERLGLPPPRVDLFYGEPSYLALVVFTCLGGYIITSQKFEGFTQSGKRYFCRTEASLTPVYVLSVVGSVVALLYIKSFSSLIYAVLISVFFFKKYAYPKIGRLTTFLVVIIAAGVVLGFTDSYAYLSHRLSMKDSLSLYQRFGLLMSFSYYDFFFGLKDADLLSEEGIHNGILYLIAIAGLFGWLFVFFMTAKVYVLSICTGIPSFFTLLFLAQLVQNGAVFSPNKIVLYAVLILPLCAALSIRKSTSQLSNNFVQVS